LDLFLGGTSTRLEEKGESWEKDSEGAGGPGPSSMTVVYNSVW